MIRNPVVAGSFYPATASRLEVEIRRHLEEGVTREEVIGAVCPHAGYIYSGPVAGAVISRIKLRDVFVILGPNHTGRGVPFSIMTEGSWLTPLGKVKINSELAAEILASSSFLREDTEAHLYEHSIEVQLPFLQYFKPDLTFVPLVLSMGPGEVYKEIGLAMARAIKKVGKQVVIIASSDMTHYEPHETAKRKDSQAIEAILSLNEDELLRRVEELHITMCGYAPTVALIVAAKQLGAREAELVKYQTSAETSGDYSSVVGYAGIIIK